VLLVDENISDVWDSRYFWSI